MMLDKEYIISEIFQSVQGEGANVGVPTVFVRFSGCNLHCPWCDTDHSAKMRMTRSSLADYIKPMVRSNAMVCFTGGEPLLQLDAELVDSVLSLGYKQVAIETNGTRERKALIEGIRRKGWEDHRIFVTVSPKSQIFFTNYMTEIKIVVEDEEGNKWIRFLMQEGANPVWGVKHRFLQPCFYKDAPERSNRALLRALSLVHQYAYEGWRLSLQMHKLVGLQ